MSKILGFGIIVFIIASFLVGLYFYPQMPDKVVSHWNSKGEADGESSKFQGLFLLPIISLGICLFLYYIPFLDPLKKNIEKSRDDYEGLILFISGFMLVMELQVVAWMNGLRINPNWIIFPLVGLMFIYIGAIMKNIRRNWFIGIRTPWTLYNDEIWSKTHKLGSRWFIISGIICIIGVFFGKYAWLFVIIPILIATLIPAGYSYILFRKKKKTDA